MTASLHTLSLRQLASLLREGALTATGLLEYYQARVERLNPRLNAIITPDPEARSSAQEADERLRQGRALGPLDGIPIAIKDNLLARGIRATWGTRVYAGFTPEEDELPIARLRSGGAVIVGKTNVPAFTLEGYTDNLVFGVTGNPWNPALTPGGSSGGAVAAVAAGLVPLAIGTDGGGSIRRPAAHTGLVGLKPSLGRVARANGLPQILLDFEVVGPLARRVDDVRLAMEVLAGPDHRDPRSRFYPKFKTGDAVFGRSLKILLVERLGYHPIDPSITRSVSRAAKHLAGRGHTIVEGALGLDIEAVAKSWPTVGKVGLAMLAQQEEQFLELAEEKYAAMAHEGAAVSASEFLQILEQISRLRSEAGALFADFDLVMMPATAAQPWPSREPYPSVIDDREVGPRGHAVFTGWVNASGHPAIALPCDPDGSGMPIGFQLIADLGQDELLLDVAEAYEADIRYHERWPPMAMI